MHGAIFGQSPYYIRDLLVPVSEMQDRTRLRSATAGLYDVLFTRTQFGRRAFSVASPSECNSRPVNMRQIPDIRQFKIALKLVISPRRIARQFFYQKCFVYYFAFICMFLV